MNSLIQQPSDCFDLSLCFQHPNQSETRFAMIFNRYITIEFTDLSTVCKIRHYVQSMRNQSANEQP
ncbi:hypothetical protein T07_12767 [Trichinella nelsoni]|uniref:Uncharacterized protein n=1 Tax=Trichinella nelsoni TaxID=6336 RepID=A0A0V0S6E5_9BILA|nr:hypothetical protein T07_12767 [Trichinella nelsoni]